LLRTALSVTFRRGERGRQGGRRGGVDLVGGDCCTKRSGLAKKGGNRLFIVRKASWEMRRLSEKKWRDLSALRRVINKKTRLEG